MAPRPARYAVLLTQGAEQDLEAIRDYIAEFDSAGKGDHVLDQLVRVAECLAQFRERAAAAGRLKRGIALHGSQARRAQFAPGNHPPPPS